jgi:hypothetical protein
MPDNPLPGGGPPPAAVYPPLSSGRARAVEAAGDGLIRARAAELARSGRLPQTTLRGYGTLADDAELPAGVMDIAPPDVDRYLFALSQQRERPLLRGGAIPRRVPGELADTDPAIADYALLVRFARFRPPARGVIPGGPGAPSGGGVAAGRVGGVGALGFGAPSGGSFAGRGGGYGSPGGFLRGYEGNAPDRDFWNRDADFRRRDYTLLHGPQPVAGSPPRGLSGPVDGAGAQGGNAPAHPASFAPPAAGYLVLELELYDLAPVRSGGKPALVWSGRAVRPDASDMAAALPALADGLFSR